MPGSSSKNRRSQKIFLTFIAYLLPFYYSEIFTDSIHSRYYHHSLYECSPHHESFLGSRLPVYPHHQPLLSGGISAVSTSSINNGVQASTSSELPDSSYFENMLWRPAQTTITSQITPSPLSSSGSEEVSYTKSE